MISGALPGGRAELETGRSGAVFQRRDRGAYPDDGTDDFNKSVQPEPSHFRLSPMEMDVLFGETSGTGSLTSMGVAMFGVGMWHGREAR